MHMLKMDGTEVPAPDPDDVHGWTVLYKTPACDHVHRVIGWVGTRQRAAVLSATAAAMLHPYVAVIPVPAPTSDMPGEACGVITHCPPEILDRVHRGEKVSAEEMAAAGVTWADMRDEVMPEPIMAANRLLELMEGEGIDVMMLLAACGSPHEAQKALLAVGPQRVWKQVMSEFPGDEMDLGEHH